MSELIEFDLNNEKIKSPAQDEFFDAEDKVESAKEDDDFMEKLDIAIGRSESPPAKLRCLEPSTDSTPSSQINDLVNDAANDKFEEVPKKLNGSVDIKLDESLLSIENAVDSDAEKIEDDLLKDLEDDRDEDLDSVCDEVKDLVDSILKDDEKLKEPTETTIEKVAECPNPSLEAEVKSIEAEDKKTENASQDKSISDLENDSTPQDDKNTEEREKKTENGTSTGAAPQDNANTNLDSDFDDLLDDEITEVNKKNTENDPVNEDVSQDLDFDKLLIGENILLNPSTEQSDKVQQDELSNDMEQELKADELMIACESPKESRRDEDKNQQEVSSDSSSSAGDAPESSSDCDKPMVIEEASNEKPNDEQQKPSDNEEPEPMEVDDGQIVVDTKTSFTDAIIESTNPDDEHLCLVADKEMTEEAEPVAPEILTDNIPLKLNFVRKFSTAAGKLARSELEELLVQKITESLVFCSENTDLRARLEKQEKISEAYKKRLDNVKKQYNDLEMIHNRVMKDLKDRPEAPITPVKITRAVGLQVYQPVPRSKLAATTTFQNLSKSSYKRPMESESTVNGKEISQENAKRKKTLKITPLRPPLSDKQRASLDLQEAKEEQKLRTNISLNVIGGISTVAVPPSVTMTPVQIASNGVKKQSDLMNSSASIDLTDDVEEGNLNTSATKLAAQPFHQPPALVAIRATNQKLQSQPSIRSSFVIKPQTISATNRQSTDIVKNIKSRNHPAPLPLTPNQMIKQGQKLIPPCPEIKINNVQNGIIVSWTVDSLGPEHAVIHSYQIYAYEVTAAQPTTENWRHVGDVKALLLPMAVTLTQFLEGQKYFFAVRAMDVHKRLSHFSQPRTWATKP